MKKVIKLTESDLIKLVKKILKEEESSQGCRKSMSSQEFMQMAQEKANPAESFHCFNVSPEFAAKIKTPVGIAKYNKQTNVLDLHEMSNSPLIYFGGTYFGNKLGSIKMSKDFSAKLPSDFYEEGMVPQFHIKGTKICLQMVGFC